MLPLVAATSVRDNHHNGDEQSGRHIDDGRFVQCSSVALDPVAGKLRMAYP
jgi:hypothetical protein